MIRLSLILALGAVFLVGCKSTKGATKPEPPPKKAAITPAKSGVGKVASVDTELGFVVLDYTLQKVPRPELRLTVYRANQKVGQVTSTRQTDDSYLIADINNGLIQIGDEVRED